VDAFLVYPAACNQAIQHAVRCSLPHSAAPPSAQRVNRTKMLLSQIPPHSKLGGAYALLSADVRKSVFSERYSDVITFEFDSAVISASNRLPLSWRSWRTLSGVAPLSREPGNTM
jgi:hypothetical protein